MSYKYGPAEKKDCAALAELISLASDGVVEYLFRDLVPGMTKQQYGAFCQLRHSLFRGNDKRQS